METMTQREKDIQALCQAVFNDLRIEIDYNNGGYFCPFCDAKSYNKSEEIKDIKHDLDCAYLIAKDLSTNY